AGREGRRVRAGHTRREARDTASRMPRPRPTWPVPRVGSGGMERRKVEIRREEILTATVEQMQRLGMARTRAQDVAAALNVSTGLLFYHFGGLDALLAAALEHAVDRDLARLDRALARGRTPLERLRRVVRAYGPTGSAP